MPFSRKATAVAEGNGKSKKGVGDSFVERESQQTARKNRRSASDAFGNDSDSSGESPLRKKQNMSSHSTTPKRATIGKKSSSNDRRNNNTASSFTQNQFHKPSYNYSRESDTGEEEEEENTVLHIAPNTQSIPTKPMALTAASTTTVTKINSSTTEKSVAALNPITSPQKTIYKDLETRDSDRICANSDPKTVRDCNEGRSWIGLLFFSCLVISSVVVWSGSLLNERSVYQLELSTCRERLTQMHHAMGLSGEVDDNEDVYDGSNVNIRLKEQLFYWKELESQVLFWKKEAKIQQNYVEGIKRQCEDNLKHLATEVGKEVESDRSEK